jgi:hypothetical protein
MVYTNIKSASLSPRHPNSTLNRKIYIYYGLEASQYLCHRRPDERQVVEKPGLSDQDVQELLVDFNKLKLK